MRKDQNQSSWNISVHLISQLSSSFELKNNLVNRSFVNKSSPIRTLFPMHLNEKPLFFLNYTFTICQEKKKNERNVYTYNTLSPISLSKSNSTKHLIISVAVSPDDKWSPYFPKLPHNHDTVIRAVGNYRRIIMDRGSITNSQEIETE